MNLAKHFILPAAALVLAVPAAAGTVSGTVKSISASSLVVTLKDGKTQALALARDSMFMRGSAMIDAAQVKPGMQVTVVLAADNKTAAHIMVEGH